MSSRVQELNRHIRALPLLESQSARIVKVLIGSLALTPVAILAIFLEQRWVALAVILILVLATVANVAYYWKAQRTLRALGFR